MEFTYFFRTWCQFRQIKNVDDYYSMFDILIFALKNTKIDIKNVCPVLWDYLNSRKLI